MTKTNGRAVAPLSEYTFLNGRTVKLRPVSQFTLAHIEMAARKKTPAPTPPSHIVEVGGKTIEEMNDADPDYQQRLVRYNADINYKVMDGMIELGVEVEVDSGELDRIRRAMELIGTPIDEISEKVAYVKHCCMIDAAADSQGLFAAITALAGPDKEAVDAHVAMFPGDVSGA